MDKKLAKRFLLKKKAEQYFYLEYTGMQIF